MRRSPDPPWYWKPWLRLPSLRAWRYREREVKSADRITAIRATRELAWFRVRGYGIWLAWSKRRRDLFSTRQTAHYCGQFRWKALRPAPVTGGRAGGRGRARATRPCSPGRRSRSSR